MGGCKNRFGTNIGCQAIQNTNENTLPGSASGWAQITGYPEHGKTPCLSPWCKFGTAGKNSNSGADAIKWFGDGTKDNACECIGNGPTSADMRAVKMGTTEDCWTAS